MAHWRPRRDVATTGPLMRAPCSFSYHRNLNLSSGNSPCGWRPLLGVTATIARIPATANFGLGLWARDVAAGSTVVNNTASFNEVGGIAAGEGSTVTGNTARSNEVGITVRCTSSVTGNTATENVSG